MLSDDIRPNAFSRRALSCFPGISPESDSSLIPGLLSPFPDRQSPPGRRVTAPRWIESLSPTTHVAESKQLCQVECSELLTSSTAVLFSKTVSTEPSSLPRDIGQMGSTAPQGYGTDATKGCYTRRIRPRWIRRVISGNGADSTA